MYLRCLPYYGAFRPKFLNAQETPILLNTTKIFEVVLMGQKIGTEKIKREKGYLYYIGKDGYVWAAPMKSNKTGKKKKVGTEKINKEAGFMYYVGKDGYVAKAKMKNA